MPDFGQVMYEQGIAIIPHIPDTSPFRKMS